jgi:SOS-response transcriptional repressor LexA
VRPLTDRQFAVLRFIHAQILSRGLPPSMREDGAEMGIRSTNGVNDHLHALERKGCLVRGHKAHSRDMKLTSTALVVLGVGIVPPTKDVAELQSEIVDIARRWVRTGNGATELREAIEMLDAILDAARSEAA